MPSSLTRESGRIYKAFGLTRELSPGSIWAERYPLTQHFRRNQR